MIVIDPHYPKLVTRRAAENLVHELLRDRIEMKHPFDSLTTSVEIDCTNVKYMSVEYAREIQRLLPRAHISLKAPVDVRINWMKAKDELRGRL